MNADLILLRLTGGFVLSSGLQISRTRVQTNVFPMQAIGDGHLPQGHSTLSKHVRLALCCGLLLLTLRAYGTEPIKIPMTAEHWRPLGPDSMGPKADLEFLKKEGFSQGLLIVKAGTSELTGLTFRTGTIEYDFKPLAADMPGIQFRDSGPEGKQDGEEIYFRMFGECRASNDCVQYAPEIHGFMLWNIYPQYQNQAFVLDGWNHVRLVVSANRLNVYVNYQPMPALGIGHLESGSGEGSMKFRGPAVFANLVITPGKVDGLSAQSLPDSTASDPGMVQHWQLSSLAPLPNPRTPVYSEMPTDPGAWTKENADRGGLLNLNRQYVVSEDPPAIGWLRFNVQAAQTGTRHVSLGWLGEVWVFVNGHLVTEGKNFYDPESERRDPDGRLSLDNGSFDIPLQKGNNEIAIALYASVHDDFRPRTRFGWGLMMRFADPHGLSFPK